MPASESSLLPVESYGRTPGDEKLLAKEASFGLIPINDPLLNQKVASMTPHAIQAGAAQEVACNLEAVAVKQRSEKKRPGKPFHVMVGLAAPQIGIAKRVIAVDTRIRSDRKRPGELTHLVNPEIIWRSRETEEGREGCFSTGPVRGLVRRSVAVKIRAQTPDGKPFERVFEGFTARIVQHEIDHLNGIRFPDRIRSDRKRHWVHAEEMTIYLKLIKRWPRICSKTRWETLAGRDMAKGRL